MEKKAGKSRSDIMGDKMAERALRVSHRFLEIANRHSRMDSLLRELAAEVKNFTGCAAAGLRVLDGEGNTLYQEYDGLNPTLYESESSLSIKSDRCICINIIKGETDPGQPLYTGYGSFYMNNTTLFPAMVSEEGQTHHVCNAAGYESVALIPIKVAAHIVGLIHIADEMENMVPLKTVEILEAVAAQLGIAIQRVAEEEKLRYFSAHDALTGLYNRTYFEEEFTRLERGRRSPVSILIADVDRLKAVNDTQGHDAGDVLLQRAAAVLTAAFRCEDIVARIGGDEFAVLLPGADRPAVKKAQERIKNILATHNSNVQGCPLSLSIGIATGKKGCSLAKVLKEADNRMYWEKQSKSSTEDARAPAVRWQQIPDVSMTV